MKIAFIHSDKKIGTGAHFINDLIACKLREKGAEVNNFYPQFLLSDTPVHFKGINNILFFILCWKNAMRYYGTILFREQHTPRSLFSVFPSQSYRILDRLPLVFCEPCRKRTFWKTDAVKFFSA